MDTKDAVTKLHEVFGRQFPVAWCIHEAKKGNLEPVIEALRSDLPIHPLEERKLREALADLLAGKFKRERGRQKVPIYERPVITTDPLSLAVYYVDRYKRVMKRRCGKVRGVEPEAIEKAANKFDVPENTIYNRIHRSKRKPRAK